MLPDVLEYPEPDCLPFRKMLAHAAVVSRLKVMCGVGFRLDHGPMFIVSVKGTAGHTMHGNGDPLPQRKTPARGGDRGRRSNRKSELISGWY